MRRNLPVTNREAEVRPDVTLVSRTDSKGIITYANQDFIEVSGYTETELIGQPHNVVRHPDMPPAAFLDLWQTISAGRPWTGIVKNRAKSGDHYWVRALVTPILENGRAIGYQSVRTMARPEEIREAELQYRKIEDGRLRGAVDTALARLVDFSIQGRVTLALGTLWAMMALASLGIDAGNHDNGHRALLTVIGVGLIVALALGRWLVRSIVIPLHRASGYFERISGGDLGVNIRIDRQDEIAPILEAAKFMQVKLMADINEIKQRANASERIKVALDGAATNIMIADSERRIIYINKACRELFSSVQEDIRLRFPDFNVDRLIGQCIDRFHSDPAHQQSILTRFDHALESRAEIGGRIFRIVASPVINDRGKRLGSVSEWYDITETLWIREREQEALRENTRIRVALDNVSTAVMIADTDRNIIYLNGATRELLSKAEPDIRQVFPDFDVDRLPGTAIDRFHNHSEHPAGPLESLAQPIKTQITLGGKHFALTASPVWNERGERLGSTLEWLDRTAEIAAEREVSRIVGEASAGNLGERLQLDAFPNGFLRDIGGDINRLLDAIELLQSDGDDQRAAARALLRELIRADNEFEAAWLWMSVAVDNLDQAAVCLDNVLRINPRNASAAAALYRIRLRDRAALKRQQRLRTTRDSAFALLWLLIVGTLCAVLASVPGLTTPA